MEWSLARGKIGDSKIGETRLLLGFSLRAAPYLVPYLTCSDARHAVTYAVVIPAKESRRDLSITAYPAFRS